MGSPAAFSYLDAGRGGGGGEEEQVWREGEGRGRRDDDKMAQ